PGRSATRPFLAPRAPAQASSSRHPSLPPPLRAVLSNSSLSRLMTGSISLTTNAATLLIVDDDTSARLELRSVFEGAGHRTITADDAPSALRLLHQEPCDLVMLDLTLPDVDGLSLCRLLRAQPAMQQLPVIVF